MKKSVDQVRVFMGAGGEVQEDPKGRFFFDDQRASFTDLSGVRLIRCGIDTVRQHYRGMLRPETLALAESKPGLVDFAGYRFHFSRVGRDSGYQYKLQNADLGLILLFKNFNVKPDASGPHLKIEVSPHAIDQQDSQRLQEQLDFLADAALTHRERSQCAVHIALDLQGWTPPADLVARLHCKATAQRRFDGVSSFEWADKSAVYGYGQSFLWGSAGACQLAIYNKTEQARATDKLDYWESVWKRYSNPFDESDPANYQEDQPVWRIELRYHHSVVQQFADGSCSVHTGQFINSDCYASLVPHLDGLWRYGLGNFRLLSRPGVNDPLWTLIRDDVRVETGRDSLLDETEYRRYYKTAKGFSGKNVDLMMGNFVTLLARQGVGAKKGIEALKTLPVWEVIQEHYAAKEMTERDIYRQIKERLEERVVRWGRAV
ncbi:hypothetical protein [Azotobacter beijerinckii]|uniref:Replication initiation factor n=1 Tax=Azotobacter beijerinckii TaxID=170623 RepID=A0A1I4GN18_9GAMM|nr:hypothetical protein [Azotobacter beijerinckii]SFL30526.1 hypothetical protein SAMN04244574_03892 [Azotobacter beijerinckii]